MEVSRIPVDLTNCDREPIHLLGAIQPVGFLLTLSADWVIARASANIASFIGFTPDFATLGTTVAATAEAQPSQRGDHNEMRGNPQGNPHANHRGDHRGEHRWQNWGGRYGYNGYQGRWRTGQRFDNWRDRQYYVTDYRSFGLPAPRCGYRYYRDSNGVFAMARHAGVDLSAMLDAMNTRETELRAEPADDTRLPADMNFVDVEASESYTKLHRL